MLSKRVTFTLLGILTTAGITQNIYSMEENTGLHRRITCAQRAVALAKSGAQGAVGCACVGVGIKGGIDAGVVFGMGAGLLCAITTNLSPSCAAALGLGVAGGAVIGGCGGAIIARNQFKAAKDNFMLAIKKEQ